TVALGFLRPLWDHCGDRDVTVLEQPPVREHATRRAEFYGADPALAELIFESPRELLARFAKLLRAYWEAAFAQEWESLEPRLAATVLEGGARRGGRGRPAGVNR